MKLIYWYWLVYYRNVMWYVLTITFQCCVELPFFPSPVSTFYVDSPFYSRFHVGDISTFYYSHYYCFYAPAVIFCFLFVLFNCLNALIRPSTIEKTFMGYSCFRTFQHNIHKLVPVRRNNFSMFLARHSSFHVVFPTVFIQSLLKLAVYCQFFVGFR